MSGWPDRRNAATLYRVSRLYMRDDGVPVMDLVSAVGGAELSVPVALLGGTKGRYLYVPPVAEESDVQGVHGWRTMPGMAWPSPGFGVDFDPEFEYPEPDKDYPERHSVEDLVLASNGARIILTKEGELVLAAPGASVLRMLLASGGRLRINQDKEEAGETVPLGNALLSFLQDLTKKLNELGDKVVALDAKYQAAFLKPSAPQQEPGFNAASVQVATQSTTSYTALADPDNALLSGSFDLCKLSQKDMAAVSVSGEEYPA